MSSVGLILLAAGASTRLGTPKQLLKYQGKSLICHAVETALASVCRPVVVVLGAGAGQIRREIESLPVAVVENPNWSLGMGSSLKAGLEALAGVCAVPPPRALIVMLCDQPLVTASLLNQLVSTYLETGKPLIACEYGGVHGVPALFADSIFERIRTLSDDDGAKSLLRGGAASVYSLPFPQAQIDVDTLADYQRLLEE